jgi:hypothetical protein
MKPVGTEGWALVHRCKAKTVDVAAQISERVSAAKYEKSASDTWDVVAVFRGRSLKEG